MLKYRRIIAGILAVNLLAGSILLDYTEVNANNLNTSLNMISAENSDEVSHADAESVNSSEKTDAENKADEKNTTPDANEKDEDTASSNSDSGLTNETQEEESTKQEPSSETAAEDASLQASETETEAEAQEISDTISLSDLKFFADNTATITSPQQLILLSHCAQNEIQNITININTTGEFNLSTKIEKDTDLSEYLNTAAIASQDYTYLGLGSTDVPFTGTITGQKPAIKTNTTLFRGISSKADINNNLSVEWQGDGTKPMFAEMYVLESDGTKSDGTIPITFTSGKGSLLGIVKKAPEETNACLTIGNVVTYQAEVQAGSSTSNDNIGLICNTLESGTIKLEGYAFPTSTEINIGSGSAGGLIGKMEGGILDLTNIGGTNISNLTVNSSSGGAGSIVGEMSGTAEIQVNQDITITNPTIKGKYAGGFAGKVDNSTLSGDKKITINSPALSSEKNEDSAVGGWVGYYIVRGESHADKTLPAQIDVVEPKVTMNGGVATNGGNAGGYFGLLELQGDINYQISGTEQKKKNITSVYTTGNGAGYGTIAGKVISDNKKTSLIINHVKSNSTTNGNSYYQGGFVGEIGENVYLQVSDAEITVSNITTTQESCGFGGVVGHLSSNSILSIADSVKVTNSGTISGGGGLVGAASSGSILEISGTTDLSGVNYSASQSVGQLVGMQDCALIFAHGDGNGNGWKYIRSNSVSKINDIGNYGEVIRLKANQTIPNAQGGLDSELLKIDPASHEIGYRASVNLTGNDITISSKEDLALLSIAWNSRGVFSADSNLTANNWTTLQSKNVNFTADVNLQNTGIIGISRDIDDSAYTGNINGDSHTLTLSIGETYGYKGGSIATNETEGCGKIYSSGSKHTDIGLFSRMRGNVSNLTITGSINAGVSNGNMWIGSIAARQETNETVISNVKVTTTIKFDTNKDSQISCIGGLFGSAAKVKLSENTGIQSNITLSNAGNGKLTYVGSAAGYMSAGTLECNGVTIGGTIATDASMYAYVGGLVGFMPPDGSDKDTSTQVNIKALTFDGFSITASNAQTACGGLLGGVWARSAVTFASDNTATTSLTVKNNTKIEAPRASVGGLAYKASGLWEIRSKGIDIQALNINCGKDLGLLVCHGEKCTINDKADGALYLRTTADWNDSYKLAEGLALTCGSKAVFDEFVAYTAVSKDKIANNDENGIVSIATKDRSGVKEENNTCNTYQNRTDFGKKHKVNANSRYYYDLDNYTETASTNTAGYNTGKIDTPEELVLWSCAVYANSNIKKYFYTFNNHQEITDIKNNILNPTISGILNMDKYSYYPIHLKTGIGITDATITFYNEQIEKVETTNKSTQATTQSQHYMMHCGLFLDHSVNETATSITLSNVTFAGSIGKVNSNASGVLFSGMVQGSESNGKQKTAKMNLNNIGLSGLKITDYKDSSYAPLLINQIGSYTKTEIKSLSTSGYTAGTAVASSLIGNAGSENGHQINMGFSEIKLPDTTVNNKGIFTHATLLESYKYAANDTSVATYNFYKSGDWNGDTYNHQVTYGKEISHSKEYKNLQKWYYDIATYNKNEGLVKTEDNQTDPDFSTWLPYVSVSYDKNNHSHEIKVNQRVFDITEGCGTYGDPYVIKDAGEMEIISEYMRTNLPRTDWKITITNDQNTYCTNHSTDITFRYNGEQWIEVSKGSGTENWVDVQNGQTRSNNFMQRYIANAYYDLQGTNRQITLNDFKGFGTTDNPFRGVLVSTNGATLILTGANTGNGLIAYSYGSVVKNLTIRYKGEKKTLVYQNSSSVFYPTSCFGGAIGCILGGDNIIDGVNVTLADGWLTLSGANKHLLQVGGYVGSVCGGGVLFRNMQGKHVLTDKMISDGSVAETATSSLYVNPYVGRVLDGYAFSDTARVNLNNTDKNYQIQNLNSSETNDTKHITASGKSIGIKDAEGLLILSAIVNSGAASSGSSNAYRNITEGALQQGYAFGNGEYGKVRNAAYDSIGANTKPNDFDTAVKDDQTAPSDSNTPVLITKYADKDLFNMAVLDATTGGATLTFPKDGRLDMSVYRSSYQGVSARYVSNAVTSKNEKTGKTETKAAGIVPLIQGVSGNGTEIIFDMNVKEYADDDFHAASVGGVFNLFAPVNSTCNVANLTFTGKTGTDPKTGVQLQYYKSNGELTAQASNWSNKTYVGVGSFAGSSAGTVAEFSGGSKWYRAFVNFNSVKFENMTIQSPAVAGGLIGNSGRIELSKGSSTPTSDIGILLQPCGGNGGQNTVYLYNTFTNCSFRNLIVNGQEKAGGFCGHVDGKVDLLNQLNVTEADLIVGQNSSISATLNNSSAGGLFGYLRRGVAINYGSGTYTAAIWENVNVEAGQYSGGLIGEIAAEAGGKAYNINNVRISGSVQSKGSSQPAGGGVIGIAYGGKTITIKDCSVNASNIKASSAAGGIVGHLKTPATITGCTVSGSNSNSSKIEGNNCASGIVGCLEVNGQVAIRNNKVEKLSLISNAAGWGSGGFVGDVSGNTSSSKIFIFDSEVTDCLITGNRAGGFAGTLRGCVKGSNLLLNNTQITASSDKSGGLLIGLTGDANLQPMTIAGISIQKTTAKENNRNISKLYGTLNKTDNTNVKNKSYFSFADYNGTASNNTTQSLLDAEQVFPYVVTSPTSQLSVYDAANTGKALYGDSAAWTKDADGKYTLNAQTIYRDAKNTQSRTAEGKYTYQEMGVEQFQFTKNISTYNKENQTKKVSNDFPVLVVSDNVSQTITDYLDIVTNGGYTRANNISGHVDTSVKTYVDTDGKFVLATNENPALEVKKASGRISEFAATTEFDNTKSRFTLLTVTFKEEDENGTEHKYNVQVPIIVRRMLEIGFTATLSSGTNYRATNYDLIEDNAHLLESTGNAFTAYLTYTYNSDDKGLYSEYGWNSYINAGGNVAEALNKSIDFQGSSLPAGTQLSLIDCQDNSKVYYYTTDSNTGNTIPLKDFKDSSGNAFQAVSIGELMGVTATQDNNNGSFIKVDAEGVPDGVPKEDGKTYTAPTVKIKTANGYEYYRKIETGESGTRYAVTVDESKLKKDGVGLVSTVHENYYLVITVGDITSGTNLNGSVQTKITSNGIPFHLNYRTRKGKETDTHSNTASTYQISHGYEQDLTESKTVTGVIKKVTATDSSMTVDVIDKITIPSGQAFNKQDELYQKFSGSLIKTLENPQSTSAEVFPNGTTGTATFYVYVMEGTTKKYYTYAKGKWTEAESTETKALEYKWTAINGLMDLPLSTKGTIDSSVNLQQIRDIVLGKKQNEFYVEVKMNAKLPANGLDVIPESQLESNLPTNYTKLTYTSQLATTKKSLSYSTARALLQKTKISYYRDEAAGVQLTYEADEIGQLGINLLDLQNSYLDAAKENTIIDTTARYDMSTIKDLSSILASSSGIQFSIQLQNKNTAQDTESYAADALKLEDYIKVSVKSEKAGTVQLTDNKKAYTWTVPRSSYWDAGNKIMKASSIFDGDIMTQAIQLKVNIKNVDQLYSNYKVVLSVKIIGPDGNGVENTTAADNIIYTMARVKPEFQDKQNN